MRDLAPVQEIADMAMQLAIANMKNVGVSESFVEEGTIVDPEAYEEKEVGRIVKVTNIGGVRTNHAQSVSAEAYAIYDRAMQLANDLSGIHDVSEGRQAAGLRSGKQVMGLQSATNRYYSPVAERRAFFYKECGLFILQLMIMTYKKGRIYRTGDRRDVFKALPVDLDKLQAVVDIEVASDTMLPKDKES
ncbi:hypothetical protein KKF84_11270, partial [Myxococcota bacterium]|nr:hypothetical protein [Myxococcota bacterium]